MRWIALASIFVDGSTALHLGFRVYSADPTADPFTSWGRPRGSRLTSPWLRPRATTRIWSISRPVGDNSQCFTDGNIARRWFLDYDPYDALEAIEVSRRWGQVINPTSQQQPPPLPAFPRWALCRLKANEPP